MAKDLKAGQFWRDRINGDLLKVLELSEYTPEPPPRTTPADQLIGKLVDLSLALQDLPPLPPIRYVRCACYCHLALFGIQEMKADRLHEDRFQQLGPIKTLWYRLRLQRR